MTRTFFSGRGSSALLPSRIGFRSGEAVHQNRHREDSPGHGPFAILPKMQYLLKYPYEGHHLCFDVFTFQTESESKS